MNKAILMGRITKDLELKYSQSGMALLSFTVAINRRKKDEVDFLSCKAFDKTAENISKFFTKGSMIAVEGRIQTSSYDNKEGQKVYTTDIMVDAFHFTGEKKGDSGQAQNNSGFAPMDNGEDELPF